MTLAAALAVGGCGAAGGGNAQQIVTAARAPLVATEHHDVEAFCAAYTPEAARQLALDRRPRIPGDCQVAMRALVTNSELGQVDKRVAAGLRVMDLVIRGHHATARISSASSDHGSTMTFSKAANGRWQIAGLSFSAVVTRIR